MRPGKKLSGDILAHARAHAAMTPPREMAGVVQGGVFVPMENRAADPARHFAIDDCVLAQGIDAVVHSHPGGPACPSAEDMAQQQASAVPWLVAVVPTSEKPTVAEEVFVFDGIPHLTMECGYRHGVHDCYSLIRGYYAHKRDVILQDYPRDWGWWHAGGDLYTRYFAEAGFTLLDDAAPKREGDVFLAAIRSPAPNHGGVLTAEGLILHHLAGNHPADAKRLPRREPVARWQKHITHWLRHDSSTEERRHDK